MNFWNYRDLAQRLAVSEVKSREGLLYYLFSAVFAALPINLEKVDHYAIQIVDGIALLIFIILACIVYKKNKNIDDKNFIERIVCLTFPIFIQSMISVFPIMVVWLIGIKFFITSEIINEISMYVLFYTIFNLFFWKKMLAGFELIQKLKLG